MIIKFHKNFDKSYRKLTRKMQDKVDQTLAKFMNDPFDKSLKNHSLQGRLHGQRAFSVTGDVVSLIHSKQLLQISYITI